MEDECTDCQTEEDTGAVTSTPHPKRQPKKTVAKAAAKAKTTVPKAAVGIVKAADGIGWLFGEEAKVSVNDGVALRTLAVHREDTLHEVRCKVAEVMNVQVKDLEMGYEAPWSAKAGAKKLPTYLTTPVELDKFWVAMDGYFAKKKKGSSDAAASIVVRNMTDAAQVSL